MHLGEYCYSQVEPLTSIAAGKTKLAPVAGCKIEADSPAGRHNIAWASNARKSFEAVALWLH